MKTTEENNRMIAEFMGYIDNGCTEDGFLIHPDTNYDIEISTLKFHTSWDWLMRAVEKIDKLMLDQPIASPFEVNAEYVFSSLREVNIKLTFKRVVQFIEWYNEQK